jgi:deazaflavin-dependent oxidoreductase (nitroreductase family)
MAARRGARVSDWNRAVIEEFRANGGRVGGRFEGRPMLLLTTTGARTGRRLTTPVVYLPDGDRMIVFGSRGGAPNHPGWVHNLRAHPTATVEVGTETFEVDAVETEGEERERLYERQTQTSPVFAEYLKRTSRRIPVIALTRRT